MGGWEKGWAAGGMYIGGRWVRRLAYDGGRLDMGSRCMYEWCMIRAGRLCRESQKEVIHAWTYTLLYIRFSQ